MPPPLRKYQPLGDYLATLEADEVALSFADIERIIGAHLPAGAYSRLFWVSTARTTYSPSFIWRSVGWHALAEPLRQQVVFRRSAPPDAPPAR